MKLEFKNVCKDFDAQRALNGVSFSVESGDILALVGPNGAGKTTLIRIAALLQRQNDGSVELDGQPLHKVGRGKIGLVSTQAFLYNDLTIEENLKLYADLLKAPAGEWERAADYFDLGEMLGKQIKTLSNGQRRRASLARLMLADPKVVLLDEPFLGLDIQATDELKKLIVRLKDEGRLVIVATHDLEIASEISTRLLILKRGKLVHYDRYNSSMGRISAIYAEKLKGAA